MATQSFRSWAPSLVIGTRSRLSLSPRFVSLSLLPSPSVQQRNPLTLACSTSSRREPLADVITDDAVPEGHRSLHTFLYGQDGARVHSPSSPVAHPGEDDGSSIAPFDAYVVARGSSRFPGVYAIYDEEQSLQYVGYSQNVVLSLRGHRDRVGPQLCSAVRVKAFLKASRTIFEEERRRWVEEFGLPPGNSRQRHLWEEGVPIEAMSDEERGQYEERKLKMRKAMGDSLCEEEVEGGEGEESRTRRLKLMQAMEGDDWSDVIDGQTRETVASSEIVSPFSTSSSTSNSTSNYTSSPTSSPTSTSASAKSIYSAEVFELTVENVDRVLDSVRPYLISDGGNVEVVSVDAGMVSLRLQGACGTCPSSTVTMKMGVERVLREKFGEALKDIVQVDQVDIAATVQAIDAQLEMLRPAIRNYSGSVEVVSLEGGVCMLEYKGPAPIRMGVSAAIKEKFPDISSVQFTD